MQTARGGTIRSGFRVSCFLAAFFLAPSASLADAALKKVEGLWAYTGLTSSGGQSMPLTGIFLFGDDRFIQQAVFNGEPYYQQSIMAHSGSYSVSEDGLVLRAEQTLSVAPTDVRPLTSQGVTEHDVDVTRAEDGLTLVFGSGTVQTFRRLSDGADAMIVPLEHGSMALVDDRLILVSGNDSHVVAGYGRYKRTGERFFIDIIRWAETDGTDTLSVRTGAISLHYDGESLRLPGGRELKIAAVD